jgi:tetratricopeptide (TPR) repeat protein
VFETALTLGKIGASAASVIGWAKSDEPFDNVKELFDALGKGGEGVSKLRGPEVPTLRKALVSSRSALEKTYRETFRNNHSPEFHENVEVAFANLGEVFDACVPQGQDLAKLRHDPQAIGEWIADAAVARKIEVFQAGEGRSLLIRLVTLAYTSLDNNPKFMSALERMNWKQSFELLTRLDTRAERLQADMTQIRELLERLPESRSLSNAEKTQFAAELARTKTELHATNTLIAGFLQAILRENIPADQFAATLFKLATDWREAGARIDALSASRNLTPKIAVLRAKAQAAHAAGNVSEATKLLEEIDAEEEQVEARLAEHQREIEAEFRLRRRGRIATKEAQISLALAGLRHTDAARFIAERVDLVEEDPAIRLVMFREIQDKFYKRGNERGLNADLAVSIEIARIATLRATDSLERGATTSDLAVSLAALGERESGAEHLQEAIAAHRAALNDYTRQHMPLEWAMTQNNLGNALVSLGTRESGIASLNEAVAAFHAALQELTRERAPLGWASTQNNLGNALKRLGDRESGTGRLEQAIDAYRAALEERIRERLPLDWAATQNNLANVLKTLGEREGGTARLEEAIDAYRAALEEYTRERVPLMWATIQTNLGNALRNLGERESGTAHLAEAVTAYCAALEERTRERVPLDWAMTQNNLGNALLGLGERESGTTRFEQAVAAYRAALQELTRQRVPLQWGTTQNNLGNALLMLGERESGTTHLEQAVATYRSALQELTRRRMPLQWAGAQTNLGNALLMLGQRGGAAGLLEEAVAAHRAALEVLTPKSTPHQWEGTQHSLEQCLALLQKASK